MLTDLIENSYKENISKIEDWRIQKLLSDVPGSVNKLYNNLIANSFLIAYSFFKIRSWFIIIIFFYVCPSSINIFIHVKENVWRWQSVKRNIAHI